ncbi:chorismate mutase [Streptomyces sp. MUM 203J]|uniref:chorismate mutase n=1 Tax=Streptomyces sp. MUM 203J TaxID=2791990 RepID=UPI001F04A9A6|nr:chorismate mutase [Streptomyces sp. MUM 203J]
MTTTAQPAAAPEQALPVLVGIDFDSIPWEAWHKPGADGRVKIAYAGDLRVRLMELPAGFDEHEWCLRGHQGYVLQGEFTIHFDDRSVPCRPGMGFVIPDDERHRSQGADGEPTVVYVVDRVPAPVTSTGDAAISELRRSIDVLDGRIVSLLAERTDVVRTLTEHKNDEVAVRSKGRVEEVVARVRALAEERGMPPGIAEATYRTLIDELTGLQLDRLAERREGAAPGGRA